MGEFNSDDHYIYYCEQESLRRYVVAIIVNKSLKCSSWMQSQKRQNDLCLFPRQIIQCHSNPSPTSNAEEAEAKQFYEDHTHDGVITHLEPDILECEVKWVLGSITMNKDSGGDGISVELFQILKDDAVKVLHSICQQIWKTQQWSQDWKRSVFILIPKKGNAKECLNYCTIALISHASKVMLKILQGRLQQYMNHELPDVQA